MEDQSRQMILSGGGEHWLLQGQFHRIGAPAITCSDGSEFWYQNGVIHRIDGPAYIGSDGRQDWYINGYRHRLDGPAIVYPDGRGEWCVDGIILFGIEEVLSSRHGLLEYYGKCRQNGINRPNAALKLGVHWNTISEIEAKHIELLMIFL